MERLKQRYAVLDQALVKLKEAIDLLKDAQQHRSIFNQKHIQAFQDSVIKRFEFCFELTWKFLKEHLEVEYGVLVSSPKKVFIECRAQGIIKDKEEALLLQIVDSRNSTTHEYNEIMARGVSNAICETYYGVIQAVIENIKQNIAQ